MPQNQDWKPGLKGDPTAWLLEADDPGVRYLALRDIVGAPAGELESARRIAHRDGPIARILDAMNPAGYWLKPGHVYFGKLRGTVWSIISLAQLGASLEADPRVAAACAYLLDNALAEGGQFSSTGNPEGAIDCLQGNLLTALLDLGCRDPRLETALNWTARTVTGEGLAPPENKKAAARFYKYKVGPRFACRANRNLPCAWGGVKVLTAFSRLPVEGRSDLIKTAIETAAEYFLQPDPATARFEGERSPAPDAKWWQFHFPLFWAADLLQVAEALTRLGYGRDPRLTATLDLIRQKQGENGRWALDYVDRNRKMWVNYGQAGRPNKWVTLRAWRVLQPAAV
jgi:hypothetical protein